MTAERMFRHDPDVALDAPLRVVIRSDPGGHAVMTFDPPSSVFAGLGDPRITAVGTELDRTVAELLAAVTVRLPRDDFLPLPGSTLAPAATHERNGYGDGGR